MPLVPEKVLSVLKPLADSIASSVLGCLVEAPLGILSFDVMEPCPLRLGSPVDDSETWWKRKKEISDSK